MRLPRSPLVIVLLLVVGLTAAAPPVMAQPPRVALDVAASTDGVQGSTVRREVGVWLDAFAAVRLADGLDLVARPILTRRAFDGSWQKLMYQLGVRYERRATGASGLGFRLDAGQLPSPIGLAMLENRPDMNPVVSQHSAYYMALPRVDREIPRVSLIGAAYPFGAQATLSGRRWDARVAAIDSSPARGRPFFGANKPPRLLNGVVGFGVTPRVGLRIGAAVAHGPYVAASELADPRGGDRDATLVQVEGEWAFGHTRISGEAVRTRLESASAYAVAAGWWVEVSHTLSPRVFVAGRADYQDYDYGRVLGEPGTAQWYGRYEAIAGYRVSPDVTFRAGYMARNGYVVWHWDDQVIASVVWQKKVW